MNRLPKPFFIFSALLVLASVTVAWGATKTPNMLMEEGKALLKAENMEEALSRFEAAYLMKPGDYKIIYHLGLAHYMRGNQQISVESLKLADHFWQKAIPLIPDEDLLKQTLEDVIKRNRENIDELQRYLQAEKRYQATNGLEEGLAYADLMLKRNLYSRAHQLYGDLSRDFPNDPRPYIEWARLVKGQGRAGWAVSFYQRALAIEPEHKAAKNELGQLQKQLELYRIEGYEAVVKASH